MRSSSGRYFRVRDDRSRRLAVQEGVESGGGGWSPERVRSRRHFIKHNAEAENVRAVINFLSQRLLRRHVGDCPHHRARMGVHPSPSYYRKRRQPGQLRSISPARSRELSRSHRA